MCCSNWCKQVLWFIFVCLELKYWRRIILESGDWSVLAPVYCYSFSLLLFILSFAWDLQESKDKHISAPCLPYKDKSVPTVLLLWTAPFSPLFNFLFQCTCKKDTSPALSKKEAKGIETYVSGGWNVTSMQLQTEEWMRSCLVPVPSTLVQMSCMQVCEGD